MFILLLLISTNSLWSIDMNAISKPSQEILSLGLDHCNVSCQLVKNFHLEKCLLKTLHKLVLFIDMKHNLLLFH